MSVPVFRSSGQPGYSAALDANPKRVFARKLPQEVTVHFTPADCTVQTSEGLVHARPGDAIVTAMEGERWRVSRGHFAAKYQPVPPTAAWQDGCYVSFANRIMAVPMSEAFEVILADGRSRLRGEPGEWLVDYGDGSLGIVSEAVFAMTYELVG